MASSYSNNLRFELPGLGEQANTWGTTLNTFMGTLLEQAISGYQVIAMPDSNYTLTTSNGGTDQARNAVIELTGTLSLDRELIAPLRAKIYFIYNNTNRQITVKASTGTGVQIPAAARRIVYCNGTTGFFDAINDLPTGTLIGGQAVVTTTGSQTLTNKTLTTPRVGTSILDSNGNEAISITATVSAVNEVTVSNAISGNAPQISATGDNADVSLNLVPKGTGTVNVSGVPVVTTTATQTLTNKTLSSPTISSATLSSPRVQTAILDSNGNESLQIAATVAAVNEFRIVNSISGTAPSIEAAGNDANININLVPKGTGRVQVSGVNVATISGTETLTNKTLTTPIISSISNTGTITLPTSTDTLVGRNTVDTLTNKTIGSTNSVTQTDDVFTLQAFGAPTKQVRISAASVTAGQTRVVTVPDSNGTILYTNGDGTSLTGLRKIGRETIWIPALAMSPRTTSGGTVGNVEVGTNRIMLRSIDFADGASILYAQFGIRMPKSWNLGTLSYSVAWTANSVSTNGVVFGLQAVALTNDETIDQAFGTAVTVTDNNTATAYQIHLSPESSALTVGSTPVAQDYVVFQIYRDPTNASDTLAATVNLVGIHLYYTTNAGDDT